MHAEISQCGRYRYLLERDWGPPLLQHETRILVVCMLNSSTADAKKNDATIRWLIGWAKKHDYTALCVVNMAAYRTPSVKEMLAAADPHGPENTSYLARYCQGDVLCAWGANGKKLPKYSQMLDAMTSSGARLLCLTTTKDGSPAHPLRKSHALELIPWSP